MCDTHLSDDQDGCEQVNVSSGTSPQLIRVVPNKGQLNSCVCVCVWLLTGADFSLAQLHLAPPASGKPRSYMATKDESSWLSWAIMLMVFVWSYVLPFWHNINMWWTHRYRTTTYSMLTNHSTAKTELEERQWTAACIVIEVSNQYRCKKTLEKKFKMLIKTFKMWEKRFKMW